MGETIILVADTEITDITRIMVEGMDPKVTVHLHTEATEHLTEVITPQVMEDTTRIARDTEVPLTVVTEAISSEVMAVMEATSLEAMAVTEAASLVVMEASELQVWRLWRLRRPQVWRLWKPQIWWRLW